MEKRKINQIVVLVSLDDSVDLHQVWLDKHQTNIIKYMLPGLFTDGHVAIAEKPVRTLQLDINNDCSN